MIKHMVIERLIREEKIEAVVLGCTELPLMYVSIPWLQSHSIRYREPSIPNDRAT